MTILLTPSGGEISRAVWVDLLQPTAEESARVQQATGLRVPTEAEVSEIESSSRLAFEKGAYYVSTPLVTPRTQPAPRSFPCPAARPCTSISARATRCGSPSWT